MALAAILFALLLLARAEGVLKSCADIYQEGETAPGVYDLDVGIEIDDPNDANYSPPKLRAYCHHGWTVFQSRGQFGNPEVTLLTYKLRHK